MTCIKTTTISNMLIATALALNISLSAEINERAVIANNIYKNILMSGDVTFDTDLILLNNLDLPHSDPLHGNIYKDDVLFMHNSGLNNSGTFLGAQAGNLTLTGDNNNAFGNGVLAALTTGRANFGFGSYALNDLQDGNQNTALGGSSGALLIAGNDNTLIGTLAGYSYINAETGNICIGKGQMGVAGENYTTRIGTDTLTTQTFIAGIENANVGTTADIVGISPQGQLGTVAQNFIIHGNEEIMGTAQLNGNVGIGQAPNNNTLSVNGNTAINGNLTVSGTISQNDSGNQINMAGSFATSTRIEWARVSAAGKILSSSAGIVSSIRTGVGRYQIICKPGMSTIPAVLINAESAQICANASIASASSAQVIITATTNGVDSIFDIVIFGLQ